MIASKPFVHKIIARNTWMVSMVLFERHLYVVSMESNKLNKGKAATGPSEDALQAWI